MREPSHYVRFVPMLSKKSAGGRWSATIESGNVAFWILRVRTCYLELKLLAPTLKIVFRQYLTQSRRWMLAASSVWTAVRAIANCGWSRYAALTV